MVDWTSLMSGAGVPNTAALLALGAAMIAVLIVVFLALYIYMGFAFSAIGKKAKLKSAMLAWIPLAGPLIVSYQISKMHWWPWLLLIGFFIPFVNFVCMLVFGVYGFIWMWKTFEAVKRPGWWALVAIGGVIPFIGFLFTLGYLALIGVAAWGKK